MNMMSALEGRPATLASMSMQLLEAIDTFQADQDSYVLGLRLARLMSLLRLHFAHEDRQMGGVADDVRAADVRTVFEREDADHARQLRRRAEETRRISERLERYAARYGDVGVALEDFATFQYDTHALIGELAERVDGERQSRS